LGTEHRNHNIKRCDEPGDEFIGTNFPGTQERFFIGANGFGFG
jgi:hypothetical protein